MPTKKEYAFIVTLKPPDYKILSILGALMCLIVVCISGAELSSSSKFYPVQWLVLLIDIFIIAYLIFIFSRQSKNKPISFRYALTAGALLWLLLQHRSLPMALLYIVASFMERQIKIPQEIGFNNDEIVIAGFISKQYQWQELNNVVLKDNMLTMDFKNNKILQKETESDVSNEIEKEFNAFCALQLKQPINNV